MSVGGTWSGEDKISLTMEYDYRQAGLSRRDWTRWMAAGAARATAGKEFWYIRSYAADRQQAETRHQVFLRLERTDAFAPHLDLQGPVGKPHRW